MSKEMIDLADEIESLAALDAHAGVGALCARNAGAIVAALRASAVAEPVAFVPVHPRHGPLWSDTFAAGSQVDRAAHYERMALYAHPAPAAPVPASVREALEHVTELLVDTWADAMDGDPEREIAVADARAALASLPAPEAAPTREEIAEWLTTEALGNILWPGMFPVGWRELSNEGAMQQARFYCFEKAEKVRDAILALKAAPAEALNGRKP